MPLSKKCPLLLLLAGIQFLSLSSTLRAQTVREYVTVDTVTVGDDFSYTITLNKDQPYDEVIFPDSSDFNSPFEIRTRQHFKVTSFKDSLVYELQFFGNEHATIPGLPVRLVNGTDTTVVRTNPVAVYFKSVLQGEEEELRPLKPIFDFAAAWWPYIAALLLLAMAAWYLFRYYKQKEAEPEEPKPEFIPVPFIDPLQTLSSSLQQLRNYPFNSREDFKQFYISLGDAIRLYFERLYDIPALESTSREILADLHRLALDQELIVHTRRVLNEADMVKFARFTPSKEQAAEALDKADAFLRRAQQVDRPRIDHLQRQHHADIEARRRQFEEQLQNKKEEV